MKHLLRFAAGSFALALSLAHAGSEDDGKAPVAIQQTEAVPLDLFKFESGYVFESDLNHGGSFGKQGEIQNEFEYGHRIQLSGNIYLHLGVAYDRYDFGSTSAPVPNHLQDIAGVIAVDYMHGKDIGAFLEIRPGFYFQNDIGSSSFDVPITAGGIFVVKENKFYAFVGAHAAFLYGGFPVLPIVGVIWIQSDQLRLMALAPEPKLIYSPTKKLDLWLGGELVGGSFRTDRNDEIQPHKLSGTQVDFADYRVGVGLTYDLSKQMTLDIGAGCSIEREFHFARAGETYRTDPSPYVRVQLTAAF
jgi:hypothetical protein